MKGRSGGRIISINKKDDSNKALLGGAAAGALTGGGGVSTPVFTSCPPEDKTFMCKLTRFYNSFKMILSIIATVIIIIGVIWLVWSYWKSSRGGKMMKKGGCGCSGTKTTY